MMTRDEWKKALTDSAHWSCFLPEHLEDDDELFVIAARSHLRELRSNPQIIEQDSHRNFYFYFSKRIKDYVKDFFEDFDTDDERERSLISAVKRCAENVRVAQEKQNIDASIASRTTTIKRTMKL